MNSVRCRVKTSPRMPSGSSTCEFGVSDLLHDASGPGDAPFLPDGPRRHPGPPLQTTVTTETTLTGTSTSVTTTLTTQTSVTSSSVTTTSTSVTQSGLVGLCGPWLGDWKGGWLGMPVQEFGRVWLRCRNLIRGHV